jgi:hypothetical protein
MLTAGFGILQPDGGKLRKGQQQLARSFSQLADFLAKLLGDLDDLLSNIVFARLAQRIFVITLNEHRRENRDQHQDAQSNRQIDMRQAR